MVTISLCMIVRDEEGTLARCLDSVKDIVDEIIIVDTGSIDKTKEIAKKYTSNIYDFEWIDDFSAARNYSFSKATKDFIMWMDADDVILEKDRINLKELKEKLDHSVGMVMMQYNLGTDIEGNPLCTYYRERIVNRRLNFKWHDPVHEYLIPAGKIIKVEIAVTHKKEKKRSSRNLDIFEKWIKSGKELSHRNYFYYARELNAQKKYSEAIKYYEKFLAQDGGLFSNYIDACVDLSKIYAKLVSTKKAVQTLLRAFEFGIPRAEICCELGRLYSQEKDYERAIAWFQIATKLEKPKNTIGSVIHDCYDYFPYAEMSICYFKLGNLKAAIEYNEKAAQFKPYSKVVQNNRKYFHSLINSSKEIINSYKPQS
ncbi:SPBc2 prophage-derived glycosyltransferase SunS [Clostridium sp. N3C]|nr:SPBc2 prophage-derived glycosyltransferase SunS [Clostridium sp. N3C]